VTLIFTDTSEERDEDSLTLKVETLGCTDSLVTIYHSTERNNPEYLNLAVSSF
jgi:hypothetical protein